MRRREFLSASATWLAGVSATGLSGCAGPALLRHGSPDDDALARLDAIGQAALVARGDVHPGELIEAAMRRIAALDPTLNAVVTRSFDRALGRVVNDRPAGPLAGVPYLLKDLTDWEGVRCTRGSRLFLNRIAPASPELVTRSEAAGLVVLGKTNTPEFGLLPSTEPLALGACRNPWDPTRSTGGSSGGAAAAVAAGLVPLAEASDGGGSIRIPAACCGVFGLKPSRGRGVNAGDGPGAYDIVVHHCVSRSVRDSALLLSLTERTGPDAPLPPVGFVREPAKRRLRIAVSTKSALGSEPDPEVRAACEEVARLCAELGHELVEQSPVYDGPAFLEHFLTLWAHGPSQLVADLEARGVAPEAVLEPWTLGLAAEYRAKPLGTLAQAIAFFDSLVPRIDAFFEDFDVWLTPVLASPPPALGELAPEVAFATLRERCVQYVGYTPLHNVAGTPAMSVPLGRSAAGLPIGLQLAARRGAEATLLALAYELEAAAPWADRWPPYAAVAGRSARALIRA
ncbi:MAG: amidase [Myxococcota bacterium]